MESATPLPADLQTDVANRIKKIYGDGVNIVFGQNQGGLANIYGTYNEPAEWYATLRYHPSFSGSAK